MKPLPRTTYRRPGTDPDPNLLSRDASLLHPTVRLAAGEVMRALHEQSIPFRVYEGYRTPARQAHLYSQGRSREGETITLARGWESYHQYGLAVDFALFIDDQWTWDKRGSRMDWWEALVDVATIYNLEPSTTETEDGHYQLAGFRLSDLLEGTLPGGGDPTWYDNLKKAAKLYNRNAGYPLAPAIG